MKDPQRAMVTPEGSPAIVAIRIWHTPNPCPGAILERIKRGRTQWKKVNYLKQKKKKKD